MIVARLVKKLGSYSVTRDDAGNYSLLDANAKEVAAGPCLEAMESAAALLSSVIPGGA